jgi:FixJ family two-component response regulator
MTEAVDDFRVLCVDDEPRVLDGMRRTLGMNFSVKTAEGGAQALALLGGPERFAVTISDMRMPGMDGAAYLEKAAEKDPDMVRMLLTGQSDIQAAIRAINQGRIFRFLTKPCDTDVLHQAVEDALEQHRLICAEKELLQKTVYGAVKVLTEMLSLANPVAFNRVARVKRLVEYTARRLELPDPWQLELAVTLAHLGYVGIQPELLERAYTGKPIDDKEKNLLASSAKTAHKLMAEIPRIDAVLAIIDKLGEPPPPLDGLKPNTKEGRLPWALHVILAAQRADELSFGHPMQRLIMDALKAEKYHAAVIEALGRAEYYALQLRKTISIGAKKLEPGMFLLEDALSEAGVIVTKGGQEVTPTIAVLLKRMAERQNLKEPLSVSVLASYEPN